LEIIELLLAINESIGCCVLFKDLLPELCLQIRSNIIWSHLLGIALQAEEH